jgi:hypothetical protein
MKSDTFNVTTLARAIETRDAKALGGLYAEGATVRIIDRDHPPSHPRELAGRPAIAAFYKDFCGRVMIHHVESAVVNASHLAFTQSCAYPAGKRVFCSAMADLEDGKIVRQTIVQAWDE